MNEIAIFGAGGLGQEVLELIRELNKKHLSWKVVGFYDDDALLLGTVVDGIRVLGGLEDLRKSTTKNVVLAVGNPEVRAKVMYKLSADKEFPTLIHPTVVFPEQSMTIGSGSIVAANTFISVNTSIGNGVLLNVGCSIGHDVEIGDFCTINPGARVSGTVKIGNSVFVGVGAVLNNNISIVDGVKIGAGSVVLKSVDKKATLFGNPARIMLE
jgi:sugar O-acyltransferase (sialic acid O-acetyltransferase NeuD family)